MKIRSKAIVISIVPACVIVAILSIYILAAYRSDLSASAVQQATVELEALAAEVDGKNFAAISTAQTMAASQSAGLYGSFQQSLKLAKQILQSHPEYQGAYFGYEPGLGYSDSPDISEPSTPEVDKCCVNGRFLPYYFRSDKGIDLAPLADMESSLYYQGLKDLWLDNQDAGPKGLITEPYVYEGVPLVEQVFPIIIDGQFQGIAGVDRKLDGLLHLIDNFTPFKSSKTYLLSRLGKIITATDRTTELSMKPLSSAPELEALFKPPTSNESSRVSIGIDPVTGEEVYVIYTRIATGEWGLVSTVESQELLQPVVQSTKNAILVAILLLLAMSAIVFALVSYLVSKPLSHIVVKFTEIAEGGGNLTTRLKAERKDEVGDLARAFNQFVDTQATMISQLDGSVRDLDEQADAIKHDLNSTLSAISYQQDENSKITHSIEDMSNTSRDVAEKVSLVASNISLARNDVEDGRSSVSKAVAEVANLKGELDEMKETVDDVSKSAQQINTVLDVINGIAEQTNLLALNAAIEAARAGDKGRGFAVVADEVRMLAQQTQSSTAEVQEVIEGLQRNSDLSVKKMEKNQKDLNELVASADVAGLSLDKVSTSMREIDDISIKISVAAEQQSVATGEIHANVETISKAVEECERLAKSTSTSVERMNGSSKQVDSMVKKFKF